MKILFVSEYWHPDIKGGGEISAYELVKNMAKKHNCTVLTRKVKGLPEKQKKDNMLILRRLDSGEPRSIIGNFQRLRFKNSVTREVSKIYKNYDIIHSLNVTSLSGLLQLKHNLAMSCFFSADDKIPLPKIVATINSPVLFCPKGDLIRCKRSCEIDCQFKNFVPCFLISEEFGKMKNKFYFRYNPLFWFFLWMHYKRKTSKYIKDCDAFIVISEHLKSLIKHPEVYVIPNIVEIKQKAKHKESNIKRIAFLGPLTKAKGTEYLEEALTYIKVPYKAYFYGTNYKSNNPNVQIRNPVEHNNIHQIYDDADVIAIPSIVPEAFGRIVIESLYFNKPVVVNNVGGLAHLWKKGNGYIVQAGMPELFGEALNDALNEKWKLNKTELKKYEAKSIIRQTEAIYRNLSGN